jgi:hypothetical protein
VRQAERGEALDHLQDGFGRALGLALVLALVERDRCPIALHLVRCPLAWQRFSLEARPAWQRPWRLMWVMVQRSPFFTHSVVLRRSRRSLLRVMITSPTLAWFPSANRTSRPAGAPSSLWLRAAVEVGDQLAGGASMIASSPAARSAAQALNAFCVVAAKSPTCTRPCFR